MKAWTASLVLTRIRSSPSRPNCVVSTGPYERSLPSLMVVAEDCTMEARHAVGKRSVRRVLVALCLKS
jgi:hypothetical protein